MKPDHGMFLRMMEAHRAHMLDEYVDREAWRAIRAERWRVARRQWAYSMMLGSGLVLNGYIWLGDFVLRGIKKLSGR